LVIEQQWDLEGLYADGIMGMSPSAHSIGEELVINELHQ
jgi:hypothetical protein